MAVEPETLSALEKVEAIVANDEVFELAELIPEPDRSRGGRRPLYPLYMLVLWEALLSVWGSTRRVEAELAHPLVWRLIRRTVKRRFPDRPDLHLPLQPMRRHHYLYGRDHYLAEPEVLEALAERHRQLAAKQARELGLLDPSGPGSFTHPDLSRMLYADGKVITPLYKAKPDDQAVDVETGEIRPKRHEPDAGLHWEGTGEAAWGTKFVMVAARTEDLRGRIILDLDWVPNPGGEAATAMDCFTRTAPQVPGALGVIYDTALRGVHHQKLLRDLGLLPVNRVTAKVAGQGDPRRDEDDQRQEKSVFLERTEITTAAGAKKKVSLFAKGGAVGIGQLTDTGDVEFVPLHRVRTNRSRNSDGRCRWYNTYELPEDLGGGTVTVRLHQNRKDTERGLNRTENVRPIPPSDPDFDRLYQRRNDAESINRHLDDTLWLGRAHSVGHIRQHLNLLGFAICVNSVALHEHRKRRDQALAA